MTSHSTPPDGIRRGHAALWILGVLVLAASVTAFAESYNGLREWAEAHRVTGVWADIWPLQVDTFIAAGELALLLSALYVWPLRVRILGWTVSLTGLAVSIVCNAGHVGVRASISDHLTASLPPVAAIAGLVIALSVMKQVSVQVSSPVPGETVPAPAPAPEVRAEAETDVAPAVEPGPAIEAAPQLTLAALETAAAPPPATDPLLRRYEELFAER